jgi:nicotinamidase-related amidase
MVNVPQPIDVAVDVKTTALLVLDLNVRCEDPRAHCHKLIEPVAKFLERARDAGIFIVFTVSASSRGTSLERVVRAFERRADEPVIFPDAFDKFYGGELQPLLDARGIKSVIVVGASSNQAVLYTATAAARPFGYDVIIPVDGITAHGDYEQEYTLHQFTVLSGGVAGKFKITQLSRISFN